MSKLEKNPLESKEVVNTPENQDPAPKKRKGKIPYAEMPPVSYVEYKKVRKQLNDKAKECLRYKWSVDGKDRRIAELEGDIKLSRELRSTYLNCSSSYHGHFMTFIEDYRENRSLIKKGLARIEELESKPDPVKLKEEKKFLEKVKVDSDSKIEICQNIIRDCEMIMQTYGGERAGNCDEVIIHAGRRAAL